jgi:hypothetical protein
MKATPFIKIGEAATMTKSLIRLTDGLFKSIECKIFGGFIESKSTSATRVLHKTFFKCFQKTLVKGLPETLLVSALRIK